LGALKVGEEGFAARLASVEARMAAACHRSGRERDAVQLIAVSKLHPAEAIAGAWRLGLRHFGENYAQELRDKHRALSDCPGLCWHAIGPIQPKNAKYVARAAQWFHALERLDVAQELSRRRDGNPLRCLIEVNMAEEPSKAGVSPRAVAALLASVRELPGLMVVGLSTMPPLVDEPEHSRQHFRAVAALARALELRELSMGTTADYEVAIEEGATWVRVGTALFGDREPRPVAPTVRFP
jgi:pyridoxal phosphate enzyme (YggS family)